MLLDTHAFLWHLWERPERSELCRSVIENPENDVLLSAGSCWEMAIKRSTGRLDIEGPFDEFVSKAIVENELTLLPVEPKHLRIVASLPFHHRDPFDRLLVAQALSEEMALLSRDERLDSYGVNRIW